MANHIIRKGEEVPVLVLDPGHKGERYNISPANSKYAESAVMWDFYKLLKKYVEEYGIKVICTRDNIDEDPSLSTRGKTAQKGDLFISLHSNAVGSKVNESIDYVAVYHLTNDTTVTCDNLSKEFAGMLAPVVAEVMGTKQGYRITSRLATYDSNHDGKMNDNYYGVLNGARKVLRPGVIVEHSFHTQTRATNWLLNRNNLIKLAKAEAKVIAKWFGMDKLFENFKVKVDIKYLNMRTGPSTSYDRIDYIPMGTYTIVEVSEDGKWGRLKSQQSYKGRLVDAWISLSYTKRV